MFVKLLASATATSAVVLRGMSYDTTNNKIVMKGHGLQDNDLLYFEKGTATGATVQGGLTENTVYAVFGKTDQGFQVKAVAKDTLAATGDAIALTTATSGHTANTFTKVGNKAKVTHVKDAANTLTIAQPGAVLAVTEKYVVYCADRATTACKIERATDTAAHADIADTKEVYPKVQVGATDTAITLAKTNGGDVLAFDAAAAPVAVTGDVWLVQKTSTVKYALVTGSWDATNNKIKVLHPFANNDIVFYKATTVNTGLTNNGVYTAVVADLNNSEFSLKGNAATVYANDTPFTADTVAVTFTGTNGTGGTFTRIKNTGADAKNNITAGTAADDKWTMGAADHNIAADDPVIFYCADKTTATNCAFAPLVDGNSYKAKTVATDKIILKGTTGTDAIDITAAVDGTGTNKGWLLEKEMYTASADGAVEVTVVSDSAGASAARGLAMFGSVVAMGAAFLMA